MAYLYKRGKQFWLCYYVHGQKFQKSLNTDNKRIARDKKKQIEYELSVGDLHIASKLSVKVVLEDFCKHLKITRTFKSYKNDLSRLRTFFGPVCESLELPKRNKDKFENAHAKAHLLEDVTPVMINRFLSDRIKHDNWVSKTANHMRQVLHKLFAYCIKHHNFRSRDRRYPNPVDAVERYNEPAVGYAGSSVDFSNPVY